MAMESDVVNVNRDKQWAAGLVRALAVTAVAVLAAGCSSGPVTGIGSVRSAAPAVPTAPITVTRTVTPSAITPSSMTTHPPASRASRTVAPREPVGRGALQDALDLATPVDPTPYMGAHPNVYFQTPSGNIGCYIFVDYGNRVECTIASYTWSQPGPDCPQGAVVKVDQFGAPSYAGCTTVPLFADPTRVLEYGTSVSNGNLECASRSTGVTCGDPSAGTGFFLSRDSFTPVR